MMKYIVIYSEDGIVWKRFKNFIYNSCKEAENDVSNIDKSVNDCSMSNTHYFEFVSEDYFNEFKKPFC